MDSVSDFGSGGCGFESHQDRFFLFCNSHIIKQKNFKIYDYSGIHSDVIVSKI